MKGVPAKEKGSLQGGGPAGLDKVQVIILGWAVDFIPDYRMARMGEMDANLVHPAGLRECANESEWPVQIAGETPHDLEPGAGPGASGVDTLLKVDAGGFVDALAEKRSVDGESILRGPAPDERDVFLRDPSTLHEHAEMARGGVCFRDEDQAACLAVEAIDDRDLAAVRKLEGQQVAEEMPHGGGVRGLAGMHLEERRLVNDDPISGLRDDIEPGGNGSELRGSGWPGHSLE